MSSMNIEEERFKYDGERVNGEIIIYQRADASKPFIGLTTFSGTMPTLRET